MVEFSFNPLLDNSHNFRVFLSGIAKLCQFNTLKNILYYFTTTYWIEDQIHSEFLPYEAKSILSLPLSSTGPKVDTIIWTGTKNGHYSTKSAYHLLSDEESVAAPGPPDPREHKQFWQELWSLNVPNKIRHFIRRACNESLPTNINERLPSTVCVNVAAVKMRTFYMWFGAAGGKRNMVGSGAMQNIPI